MRSSIKYSFDLRKHSVDPSWINILRTIEFKITCEDLYEILFFRRSQKRLNTNKGCSRGKKCNRKNLCPYKNVYSSVCSQPGLACFFLAWDDTG